MMLDRLAEGNDIVCGWRKDRKDPWLTRRVLSRFANWLISVTAGVRLHDTGCSLKVLRAEVVKPLRLFGEMHRFVPAIATEQGVQIAEVVVNHRARKYGRSKYGLSRIIRVLFDLVTVKFLLSFSTRPCRYLVRRVCCSGRSALASRRIWGTSGCLTGSRSRGARCCCWAS